VTGGLALAALLARLSILQSDQAPTDSPAPEPPAPQAPADAPAAAPAAERPAPGRHAPERAAQAVPLVEDVREGSVAIVQAIVTRDLEALALLTPTPFSFDGTEVTTRAAVRQRWAALLERYPVDQLQLRGVEVLSYDDLVARHGKPPARLQRLPLQGTQAAILDLNGKGAVLLWRKRAKGFQVFAISD
jgi:hypothetical protein